MTKKRYQALGPLLAGEGSRAFIGLEISKDGRADPVVLVWVPEGADKDPVLLDRIRRETEHAAKLDHPNIVRVHGFASLEEGFARVVEFADGESLRKLLELAKKLPPKIAAKIVCDAATGVHYAHVAGNDDGTPLVHGDIRPETLLMSFTGAVKVTGYGALAFAPREIGGQRVKGRRVHTAPEQIISGRDAFVLQTDVYLLGLTLYECLTGKVPFADQNEFFDHAVLTLPLQPPSPGEVPEELEKIIFKACSKKVTDRYPTPLALREEIEKALGTLPSNDELAAFLKTYFPDSDQVRAARRQAIDAGVADYARKVWAERKMEPVFTPSGGTPMLPPTKTPMATPAISVGATTGPAPKPPPRAPQPPPPIEPEVRSRTPLVLGGIGVVMIGAIWWAVSKANAPLETRPVVVQKVFDAGTPAVVAPPPVPVVTVVDAGVEPEKPVIDAGPPIPVIPEVVAAAVFIDSRPSVELSIDGKVLGRTPWRGSLPLGRKLLLLVNKDLGLRTSRAIVVAAGDPNEESFVFAQGFVTLSAPEGAQVFVDDRRIGSAPIRGEIPVYEGGHRISVTVGKARWSEPFNLNGGQRINFNVEMQ